MRRQAGAFLMVVGVLCLAGRLAGAAIPQLMKFQGKVTDAVGAPLNGNYDITFRIYDAQTGGVLLWSETQIGVPVTEGVFGVLLGNVTPLDLPFDQPYWLAMEINNDGEMTPRQAITSAGYAYRAKVADSVTGSATLPKGAIILWRGTGCPAGYSRVTELDDKFLVSGPTYNAAAGGSNTHNHGGVTGSTALTIAQMPAHSHDLKLNNDTPGSYGYLPKQNWNAAHTETIKTEVTGSGQGHDHTIDPADNRPAFATILLCEKN